MVRTNEQHTWSGENALFLNSFQQFPLPERVEKLKEAIAEVKTQSHLSQLEKDALTIRLHADLARAETDLISFCREESLATIPNELQLVQEKLAAVLGLLKTQWETHASALGVFKLLFKN